MLVFDVFRPLDPRGHKMIIWFNQCEFWEYFAKVSPAIRIDYVGWCCFRLSFEELRFKIGAMEPNEDLRGEDDLPGPVSRWYGNLDGVPVLLDFEHSDPGGESVVIHHGEREGARDKVRSEFENWGLEWSESREL